MRVVLEDVLQVGGASGQRHIITTIISEISVPSYCKPANIALIQSPSPSRRST
jgi:hypothetical protein